MFNADFSFHEKINFLSFPVVDQLISMAISSVTTVLYFGEISGWTHFIYPRMVF